MSRVRASVNFQQSGRSFVIGVEGLESVEEALGDLRSKAPAALKVAVNATARQARKQMIAQAKARYAVNAAGQRRLKELKQNKKATNTSTWTRLYIAEPRSDLGYFQHSPTQVYSGREVFERAPAYVRARVLKTSSMENLTGTQGLSKGFLAQFKSGHIGMVQRVIGSHSTHTTTENGRPRWRNSRGNVEKLQTMGSPSASAMHGVVWPQVQEDMGEYLLDRLDAQVEKILERAAAKKG